MSEKIYYKVVGIRAEDVLVSATMRETGTCVLYIIGKPARPIIEGSKLFIFEKLADALYFAGDSNGLAVYTCHAENVERGDYMNAVCLDVWGIRKFWRARAGGTLNLDKVTSVPDGTLYCDSVTLIEEVHRGERR